MSTPTASRRRKAAPLIDPDVGQPQPGSTLSEDGGTAILLPAVRFSHD